MRFGSFVPPCARLLVVAVVVAAGALGAAPGVAGAQDACPEANPTDTSNCGPTFVVPAWGDAGGWTDPSKSSTIQLADFNGDGRDELMARNDQGIEIYWFDTSLGQWRPQVDGNGVQQVIKDFRSPLPSEDPATNWTQPEYFSTIQTAHINGAPSCATCGQKAAQVLARFADGMRVYYFNPGPGGSINGGSWSLLSSGGPFSDADGWDDASMYSTIRTIIMDQGNPGITHLVGRSHDGLVGYSWNGGGWSPLPLSNASEVSVFEDATCLLPSCTFEFRAQQIGSCWAPPTGCNASGPPQAMIGRRADGLNSVRYFNLGPGGAVWQLDNASPLITGPDGARFGDLVGGPDCPFPGTSDCLSTSPSYYETLGVADFNSDGVDEVYARAADGLRVVRRNIEPQADLLVDTDPAWTQLATLTDLAGTAENLNELLLPGLWGSIRTGHVTGNGRNVVAIGFDGLDMWEYDAGSNSWSKLPGQVGLHPDPWLDHPEYYATIRLGDVDGDGHDDVVARGPYGIRTWFYNRPGQPGWGRYLPDGYPDFPNPTCDQGVTAPCGQQAAFAALNTAAQGQGLIASGGTLRDVWANAPDLKTLPGTLPGLSLDVQGSGVGNCPAANKTHAEPPTYSSCIPPAPPAGGSNGFNGAGWTEVVNEILSEIYFAEQVDNHFTDVATMRDGLFESATGSLPAIGNDLQIAGANNNTASFNLQGFFAGATGIAASIAGLVPGEGAIASAALWVASELISMLPSASPTATSSFQTTYDGLVDKLATAQDEMADAWTSQQQQVLGDQGLLRLVGQLRSQGTWKPDVDGMLSASRQSFVLETYQALLPTMYQRYAVTNCSNTQYWSCDVPSGPDVIGPSDGTSATWIGPPSANPCAAYYPAAVFCDYSKDPGTIPDSVANIVWGAMKDTCSYQPGNTNTLWHFGCSLGVPVATSIAADSPGWTFTTRNGGPVVSSLGGVRAPVSATPGVVRAGAARGGSGARAAQAGSSALRPRHLLAPLRFSGRVRLSRALRLRRMRVSVERTLFEHGRREQLARSRTGRRLRPFALRHVRGGRFTSHRRGRPRVRLHIRRLDARGGARLDLRLTRVRTRDIRALCTVLPASVSPAGRPLELETRLRLRDRGVTTRVTMRQRWRCVRDRKGEFTGIRPIKPRRPAARPGLAVRLGAPRVLASGRRATVRVTVANQRRRRSDRVASSLWDLRITGGAGSTPRTIRFKELRAGRSRTVRLTVPVPLAARGRVCVRVAAGAASARGATARRCAPAARSPRFTGCSAVTNAACASAIKRQPAARARPPAPASG